MTADTPLARAITARITADGPITVGQFMDIALNDPTYGYYRTRAAIGAEGDFITAPEITQVFGEIVGLWGAVVWQMMGSPAKIRLIEIGPGRGTLMADLLRAARMVPAFSAALDVHLVESNHVLRNAQRERLAEAQQPLAWHQSFAELHGSHKGIEAPSILIANEFLDTCLARQMVRRDAGWVERCVGLDEMGQFVFVEGLRVMDPDAEALPHEAKLGDIFEVQDFGFLDAVAALSEQGALAALFFDYGHMRSSVGDTLQALKAHAPEPPLASPGDADLTVHVDFEAFAKEASKRSLVADGPLPQGEFLGRLGIVERASRLMAANPAKASAIEVAVGRILSPNGMGSRFKAIGLRKGVAAALPGF